MREQRVISHGFGERIERNKETLKREKVSAQYTHPTHK
jgi:hypothetical protein